MLRGLDLLSADLFSALERLLLRALNDADAGNVLKELGSPPKKEGLTSFLRRMGGAGPTRDLQAMLVAKLWALRRENEEEEEDGGVARPSTSSTSSAATGAETSTTPVLTESSAFVDVRIADLQDMRYDTQIARIRHQIVSEYLPALREECDHLRKTAKKWKEQRADTTTVEDAGAPRGVDEEDLPSSMLAERTAGESSTTTSSTINKEPFPFVDCHPALSALWPLDELLKMLNEERTGRGAKGDVKSIQLGTVITHLATYPVYMVMDDVGKGAQPLDDFFKKTTASRQRDGRRSTAEDQLLHERKLSEKRDRDLVSVYAQAHRALTFLHRTVGLVHNDIQPGNILVRWEGGRPSSRPVIKIVDFGLAAEVGEPCPSLQPGGYAAPDKLDCMMANPKCEHPSQPADDFFALSIAFLDVTQTMGIGGSWTRLPAVPGKEGRIARLRWIVDQAEQVREDFWTLLMMYSPMIWTTRAEVA